MTFKKTLAFLLALATAGSTMPITNEEREAKKAAREAEKSQEQMGKTAKTIWETGGKVLPIIKESDYLKEASQQLTPFPGTIERKIKKWFYPSIVTIITKEDQDLLIDFADILGKKFVPETEIVLDLSNHNLSSIDEIPYYIEKEQIMLKDQIAALDKEIRQIQADIDLAKKHNIKFAATEGQQKLDELLEQRKNLQKKLRSLRKDKITILRLARNNFEYIPSEAFKDYPNLKAIDLGSNSITNVRPLAFAGLKKLSVLSLSGNPLDELSPLALIGNKNLAVLDISATKLIIMPESTQKKLQNIEALRETLPSVYIIRRGLDRRALINLVKLTTITTVGIVIYTFAPGVAGFLGISTGGKTTIALIATISGELIIRAQDFL